MTDFNDYKDHFVTEDGVDHGKNHVEECLNALVYRCEDGYIHCVIIWSGGSCEDCMKQFEGRMEREEADDG